MADLIDEWLAAQAEWAAATAAARPAKQCNRMLDRARVLAREIAGHPELHRSSPPCASLRKTLTCAWAQHRCANAWTSPGLPTR